MSKKIIIGVALFILIIILTIIGIVLLNKKEYYELDINDVYIEKKEIDVYEKTILSEIIHLCDECILSKDYDIDTDEIGEKILEINYTKDNDKYKGSLEVNVVDKVPPYIGIGSYYNHIKDTNFTFDKDILCADNYDRNIKCEIIGDYNLTELKETNLKVVAEDQSGNVTEKNFILKIVEKTNNQSKPTYISLNEALERKPENAEIMIDVSKWQEDIDWEKVKEAGVNYAMLRLGTQRNVDEDSVIDAYFEKNIKEAHENGIKVGVYYYTYANDIEDAKVQAKWVKEQLKNYNLELPVAFDWECWRKFNDFHISLHDLNEIARTFLSELEKDGYKVVNYGSKSYLERIWVLDEYDIWLAHYTKETNFSKDYVMWQFTDSGLLNGVKGPVDFNYLYIAQ